MYSCIISLYSLGFAYPGTERVYDLVNHIGGVFRYFIVDVVDPGSTPDVVCCGRELGEKLLCHEQGLNQWERSKGPGDVTNPQGSLVRVTIDSTSGIRRTTNSATSGIRA